MKRFVLVGGIIVAILALASPAAAHHGKHKNKGTECTSTMTGASIQGDLVVPDNASCTIVNSQVGRNVKVGQNSFFQATNSDISGDILAQDSQTIFTEAGTHVGGDVSARDTAQVFLFDGTIDDGIKVDGATDKVNICGNTVSGRLEVKNSGRDILVGDTTNGAQCAGNTVTDGHSLRVKDNSVDVELVVSDNTLQGGDLLVDRNTGPADKAVQDNKGGDELKCRDNDQPFTASGNTGWNDTEGQCAVPPTQCTTAQIGAKIDGDLVVPDNASCTLTNSTVGGNVEVGQNSFFQATNTKIGGDVRGQDSQTVFIDTGSSVGGRVDTSSTAQVFVFNATIGDEVDIRDTTSVVNVCGNHVTRDVEVFGSGRDILVGDTTNGAQCAGNTVGRDIKVIRNNVDVELVVSDNAVGDDLVVHENEGPADKAVQNNSGGDTISCFDNDPTFTGSPNSGFGDAEGGCSST